MHNHRNAFLLANTLITLLSHLNGGIISSLCAMIYDVKKPNHHAQLTLMSLSCLSSLQAGALDLKENLAAAGGAPWPYPAVYPYEAAFAGYPFNG